MYTITKPKPWITVVSIPFDDIEMLDLQMGNEPVEKPRDLYKRLAKKPAFIMNGVMYDVKTGKTCTNAVDDGKRVSYGFSTFGLVTQKDGSFSFSDYSSVKGCKDFAGGGPALIKNGVISIDGNYGAYFMGDNPRSSVGRSKTDFIMVAIDGRNEVNDVVYEGMTVREEAEFMLSLGCVDAINFDGGGSTILLHNGKEINTPCDDRAVDNMLCIYLKEGVTGMTKRIVYISASTQSQNIGVGQYGTEQDRMMYLADRVKFWLETQSGKFEVHRNKPGWDLIETVHDCNLLNCELFLDNHSDAGTVEQIAGDGGAEGTSAFYYHQGGITSNSYKLASLVYKHISPLSPGKDKGIFPDNKYVKGLYVIQNTNPPAALVEHMYHTNLQEVNDMIAHADKYAKEEAKAICEYFGIAWIEPVELVTKEQSVAILVKEMIKDGIVTDEKSWNDVLNGKIPAKYEYLQIAFRRAVDKIL